jgi:hypothetical protein
VTTPHHHSKADASVLLTPAEAAIRLRVRESWLRKKAAARAIPCTFLGKHLAQRRGLGHVCGEVRHREASVRYADGVAVDDLIGTGATDWVVRRPPGSAGAAVDGLASLRTRLWMSIVLTVPVIAMATVPAGRITYWQWLSLTPGRASWSASEVLHGVLHR